jgi:hypothetical protein
MYGAKTTAEARTLLCPWRSGENCVARGCMGWREITGPNKYVKTLDGRKPQGDSWTPLVKADGYQVWRRPQSESERLGYCGAVVGEMRIYSDGDPWAKIVEGEPLDSSSVAPTQDNGTGK